MGSAQSKSTQSVESKIAAANSMAQQASAALICGPDCQQRNTEATLKQQYTDASTNITIHLPEVMAVKHIVRFWMVNIKKLRTILKLI